MNNSKFAGPLVASLAIASIALYLASKSSDTKLSVLALTMGWLLALLLGLIGMTILWQIWIGKIDMSQLFSEGDSGKASFSRFQFFIFTFVVAMGLFLVIIGDGTSAAQFPKEIPPTILALIGISAGSYLISKGIPPGGQPGESDKASKTVADLGTQLKVMQTTLGALTAGEDAKITTVRGLVDTAIKTVNT